MKMTRFRAAAAIMVIWMVVNAATSLFNPARAANSGDVPRISPCCQPLPIAISVLVDGTTVPWSELGDPSGYPLLWLGGIDDASVIAQWFQAFDGYLRAKHVRLILMETPGVFNGLPLVNATPSRIAEVAMQFMQTFGYERFAVYGYSHQGPFALALAAQFPRNVSSLHLSAFRGQMKDAFVPRFSELEVFLAGASIEQLEATLQIVYSVPLANQVLPSELAVTDKIEGLRTVFRSPFLQPLDYRYAAEVFYSGLHSHDYDLGNISCTVYLYSSDHDYFFPTPSVYVEQVRNTVAGAVVETLYSNEAHLDSMIRHFDQVVLDVSVGDRVIISHQGRDQVVSRDSIKDHLTHGDVLGMSFWIN